MVRDNFTMRVNLIPDKKLKLTVILSCFGEISLIEKPLEYTIDCLSQVKDYITLIVVTDGKQYLQMPSIQNIEYIFPSNKIITVEGGRDRPAKIINAALNYIETQYVSFAWPGSHFDLTMQQFAKDSTCGSQVYAIKNLITCKIAAAPNTSLIYSWLQYTKLFELNNIIVSNEAVKIIGEFDQSPLLQKDFDWEWMIRLSKYFTFTLLGVTVTNNILTFDNYPFSEPFNFNPDIIHRYLLRSKIIPYKTYSDSITETEQAFLKDLQAEDINGVKNVFDKNELESCTMVGKMWSKRMKSRYKITIIGGYWEYHHNQLCFFNYFDKLYGKGFATYKVLLDEITSAEDVKSSDLVIITRSRNSKILEVINLCKKDGIPTLYMLDDNWFSIAKDLPETYGQLFIPGNPQFDTFIEAIKKCDAVITYNKYLYEDILKHNKNTILFPVNINLDFYPPDEKETCKEYEKNEIIVGYAGSLRHDDIAFKALSNVAKRHSEIKVLLFGGFSESQLSLFRDVDTTILSHMPYPIFCETIKKIAPDILLAPLINNRSAMSKCPNKYLEIGAIKAAGIYTDIYPYNEIVKDKVNGLIVTSNTVEQWEQKILSLICNKKLLMYIKERCHNDVEKHYSTDRLLKKFCKMIKSVSTKNR